MATTSAAVVQAWLVARRAWARRRGVRPSSRAASSRSRSEETTKLRADDRAASARAYSYWNSGSSISVGRPGRRLERAIRPISSSARRATPRANPEWATHVSPLAPMRYSGPHRTGPEDLEGVGDAHRPGRDPVVDAGRGHQPDDVPVAEQLHRLPGEDADHDAGQPVLQPDGGPVVGHLPEAAEEPVGVGGAGGEAEPPLHPVAGR